MTTSQVLDPSTYILREVTPAEKIACWRINSASWAGKLTVDDYVGRETVNGSGELSRDGGIRYWGFTAPPTDGGTDGQEIYAAVESIRKPVVVKTSDGGFSIEWSYAAAGVFTPAKYRGKKVAAWMMRRLGEWFDSEEASCRFSILYSDVGEYYSPLGWPCFPSLETSLPPIAAAAAASSDTTPLTVSTLPPLCERDVSALVSYVRTAPLEPGTHTRLAFLPTYAQAAWHFGAEEFAASKLFTAPARTPSIKGAISSSGETWAYWVHDYNDEKLSLLRLVSLHPLSTLEDKEKAVLELAAVLRAAQAEAASWAFKKVVLWNPDQRTLAACKLVLGDGKEVEVQQRTESIACLRWNWGSGRRGWEKGVDWVASEKYSWC